MLFDKKMGCSSFVEAKICGRLSLLAMIPLFPLIDEAAPLKVERTNWLSKSKDKGSIH
jgi:hypothetical protein